MRLVPLESCAILTIDWAKLKAAGELSRLMNHGEFEVVLRRIGVDGDKVQTVTIFSSMDGKSNSGLLLRGSLGWKEIASKLKAGGWREEHLEGRRVYVKSAEFVALPESNILFVGTKAGAEAVFRASKDTSESIVSSEAYKKVNAALTAKSQPLRAFLLVPQGTLEMADAALTATSLALSLFNLGGVGQLLQAANVARGIALIVDKETKENYPVELCVLFRDEESARFVSGSLNAMKTISELATSDKRDRENLRALREMTIVRKREVLAVRMRVPISALFPPTRS